MTQPIRSFIAIPLSDDIHQKLADFDRQNEIDKQSSGLRPVKPINIHLTLKFLGEIELSQVAALSVHLNQVVKNLAPFTMLVQGLGAFPGWNKHPRAIWVDASPKSTIEEVYKRVNLSIEKFGFPPEKRVFSPHLTLARISYESPSTESLLKRLMAISPPPTFGEMLVNKIVLFKSVLLPDGPVYSILSSHSFSQ